MNLQENLQAIAQANSTLASIKNQTATMTTQLGAFNSIWSAVVDDANQVIFYLMDAEGPTDQLVSVYASAMSIADHEYRSP